MGKKHRIITISILVLLACISLTLAQTSDMGLEHDKKMGKTGKTEQHEGPVMGMDTPRWKQTLTEEQKMKADKMHLELKKAMSILEAKMNLKEAELNNLVTQDNADTKAIHRAIDEVMELKKEMMIKKYDHMVEMRSILTPDQRVSFDLGLSGGMGGMGGMQQGHH